MSLNQEAIVGLAEDLIANGKRYDQNIFGDKTDCGTTCCLAGLVRLRKIGIIKFNRELKEFNKSGLSTGFGDRCIEDGCLLLDIPVEKGDDGEGGETTRTPAIFDIVDFWPYDLAIEYEEAKNDARRVTVAIKALQRLLPDGYIDLEEDVVHTDLSAQLEKISLLGTGKKGNKGE